jgi:hypothetical protein
MHEVQAAYIVSGSGVLHYQGSDYPLTVGGAGIGGIGAWTIEGRGDVYNLTNVAQSPAHMLRVATGFIRAEERG